MRTSDYTIYVKLKYADAHLLFHGYTGAIDLVNDTTVQLMHHEKYAEIHEQTRSSLQRRGYLTDMSADDEHERVRQMDMLLQKRALQHHSFLFLVSYDCNFRCGYCYEQSISGRGEAWSKTAFSTEMIAAAFTAIDTLASEDDKTQHIYLYGGEPLLSKNYDILENIVHQGVSRGFSFYAITNGYEVDRFEKLLGRQAINHLQVTLDGSRDTHNQRRKFFNGCGTFDRIIENISMALGEGVKISLRVNLDKQNLSDLDDLVRLFVRKGWTENFNFRCYVSPLHQISHERVGQRTIHEQCLQSEPALDFSVVQKNEILRYIDSQRALNPAYSVFLPPDNNLTQQMKEVFKTRKGFSLHSAYCGANNANYIFDPYGDLYACLETVGLSAEKIGTFFPTVHLEDRQVREWRGRTISALRQCATCKYGLFCGGGCMTFARRNAGDARTSFCDEFPAVFAWAANRAFFEFTTERSHSQELRNVKTDVVQEKDDGS